MNYFLKFFSLSIFFAQNDRILFIFEMHTFY